MMGLDVESLFIAKLHLQTPREVKRMVHSAGKLLMDSEVERKLARLPCPNCGAAK